MRKNLCYILITFFIGNANAQGPQDKQQDWLLHSAGYKSTVTKSGDEKDITLSNGLVQRVFRITPNVACTGYQNLTNGQQLLRAVEPEAILVINGKFINVGGLTGQKEKAYLRPGWIDAMQAGAE